MSTGNLKVEAHIADSAIPIAGAHVIIREPNGTVLYNLLTDLSGSTEFVNLDAPAKESTLTPNDPNPHYGLYDVEISKPGVFVTEIIHNVEIFDGIPAILPVTLLPSPDTRNWVNEIDIPPPAVEQGGPRNQTDPSDNVIRGVTIPEYITVHLGRFNEPARNVRVPFTDYIKNVASSEIYPTWPPASLESNILAIITFALNRIYTEWYRSRGYPFDITNSTATDQAYIEGRDIFSNISHIVDELFNSFVRRPGLAEPFFTSFCNGTTATCEGLSQWGTVPLANEGREPLEIIRHFYPSDVEIVTTNNIANIPASYPSTPLQEGSEGEDVERIQKYLNRIRANYPLIPTIPNPNGVFDSITAEAVRTFQGIFNMVQDGIVGPGTWNQITRIFVAVTRLAELNSEGKRIGIGENPPTSVLRQGSRGADVNELQFILNYLAEFYPDIPPVIRDSAFGPGTRESVMAFQSLFGLASDGIVGPGTWNMLYQIYHRAQNAETPPEVTPPAAAPSEEMPPAVTPPEEMPPAAASPEVTPPAEPPAYPGTLLRVGSSGDDVALIQNTLNQIAAVYTEIPSLTVDGSFGPLTQASVLAFQRIFGLKQDGIVGPVTWDAITSTAYTL